MKGSFFGLFMLFSLHLTRRPNWPLSSLLKQKRKLHVHTHTTCIHTKVISSQLSGITATEGVESEANHHPLLIRILADEMNVKRKFQKNYYPCPEHFR